jgi:hypothetical protein
MVFETIFKMLRSLVKGVLNERVLVAIPITVPGQWPGANFVTLCRTFVYI